MTESQLVSIIDQTLEAAGHLSFPQNSNVTGHRKNTRYKRGTSQKAMQEKFRLAGKPAFFARFSEERMAAHRSSAKLQELNRLRRLLADSASDGSFQERLAAGEFALPD